MRTTVAPVRAHEAARQDPSLALRDSRVGVVSIARTSGDGVSYVARLVHRAIGELAGTQPWTLDLSPARAGRVSLSERARFVSRLVEAQWTRRVDHLLFTHLGPARAQRLVPPGRRRSYGVFVHGIELWSEPLTADRLAALRGAAVRVANSHFTARRVAALYPAIGPVEPCPLALLPAVAHDGVPDPALLSRIDGRWSVLIVGRTSVSERYKGHDELIECWPEVLARVPGAQLVVAGGGDDLERLRRKATSAALGDRILFCGHVSDATLQELFERVALFAMPSRGEGFGIVYLEAMRAGRPCIASPDDGGADVVEDGVTGLLARQSDRAALAAAVAGLLVNPDRAAALGSAGRRRYESLFTFDHFRARLGTILGSAFAGMSRETL